MRRHTVGIAHPQNDTGAPPTDTAHYFTQHHHHQPAGAGPFLHPPVFVPGVAAAHGLPHIFMPQDLSVHSASEDESLPTNSSAIADAHLLRPPQIAGMIAAVSLFTQTHTLLLVYLYLYCLSYITCYALFHQFSPSVCPSVRPSVCLSVCPMPVLCLNRRTFRHTF